MSEPKSLSFDWAFWYKWIMATTLGWVLGSLLFPGLGPLLAGFAIGVLQWLVLQQRLTRPWTWILATAIGWAAGWAINLFLSPGNLDLIGSMVIGVTTGISQWLVLRHAVHWAAWWVVINVVGWTTGLTLLPGVILTGVMAGVVTGFALELLLRYPKPHKENVQDEI